MAEVKLIADSGGGTVALKAPASTTSNAALVLKLPVADGSTGQAVTTNGSGQLAFTTISSSPTTTRGDIIFRGASADVRLAKGSNGQYLQMGANDPAWVTLSTSPTTTAGDIIYRGNTADSRLAKGTAGQVLKMNSGATAPEWGSVSITSDTQGNTVVGSTDLPGTDADNCVLVGKDAGTALTGDNNVVIGEAAVAEGTSVGNSVYVGKSAGRYMDTGEYNTAVGYEALRCASGTATHPDNNVAIGYEAMKGATEANENVAVGNQTLFDITTGTENVALGRYALTNVTSGLRNVAAGYNAGLAITDAEHNVCVGFAAGATITTGDQNVCIGLNAGNNQITTDDNQLYIARSNDASGNDAVWIYGDHLGRLYNGDNSSSWHTTSDRRLKKNIVDSPKGLTEINQIRVVNFEYKEKEEIDMSEFPLADDPIQVRLGKGKEGKVQTGFIAQEVEAILPECINTTTKGAKTVDTDPIVWALVNAVKELSAKVETLEKA